MGRRRRSASLLRTLGVVYIGIAVVIPMLTTFAAPWIGAHSLQAKFLPTSTVTQAVMLMGVNLACRWPISHWVLIAHRLARSGCDEHGSEHLRRDHAIAVLASSVRSIQAFFVVQAAFGLLQVIVLRMLARRALGECDAPYDFSDLKRVWHFSAWMGGVAITGLLVSQFDKIVLSRIVPLESFAHYMLAALLVSGLQIFTMPAFNTLYPKFSALIARGDTAALEYLTARQPSCLRPRCSRWHLAWSFDTPTGNSMAWQCHRRRGDSPDFRMACGRLGSQRHHVLPIQPAACVRPAAARVRHRGWPSDSGYSCRASPGSVVWDVGRRAGLGHGQPVLHGCRDLAYRQEGDGVRRLAMAASQRKRPRTCDARSGIDWCMDMPHARCRAVDCVGDWRHRRLGRSCAGCRWQLFAERIPACSGHGIRQPDARTIGIGVRNAKQGH